MSLRFRLEQAGAAGTGRLLRSTGAFNSFFGTWRHHFNTFERLGLHVLPVHYYSPVPDTRTLHPLLWQRWSDLPGIRIDEDRALGLLRKFSGSYREEYSKFPADAQPDRSRYYRNNPAFRSVDASILYSFVRSERPKRIIEIGAGFSTLVTAQAITANKAEDPSYVCEFTSIEPYPPAYIEQGFPGSPEIIRSPVQDVPLSTFESLGGGGILFIDSTHVLRTGSDVQFEYLDILPRVRPGTLVHIHDIFLPAEYPKEWITEFRFFWNEQYLLQAFLAFNERFDVVLPAHLMHLKHADEMQRAFPGYAPESLTRAEAPASWWMRRV